MPGYEWPKATSMQHMMIVLRGQATMLLQGIITFSISWLEVVNSPALIYKHCTKLNKHFNTSGRLSGVKNNLAIETRPDPIIFTGAYTESNNAP